jgi:hypothetical protein
MFLINFFGVLWYGGEEWERRKRGQHFGDEKVVEPYFSHPLDREAWKLRCERIGRKVK